MSALDISRSWYWVSRLEISCRSGEASSAAWDGVAALTSAIKSVNPLSVS